MHGTGCDHSSKESNNSASNIGAMLNQFRNSVERVLQNVEQCQLNRGFKWLERRLKIYIERG